MTEEAEEFSNSMKKVLESPSIRELVLNIHASKVSKNGADIHSIKNEGVRLGIISKKINLSCGSCVWNMICTMKNHYDNRK